MAQMNRRDFLKLTSAGATALALPRHNPQSAIPNPQSKGPNILFLFADDMRWDAVGAFGRDAVKTPNLDALAARSVVFERPYIMGSTIGAVCVCSRAMLMTGRHLWHVEQNIQPDAAMLPETLQRAGYTAFGAGKWHNGPASFARGFNAGGSIFFGGMGDHDKLVVSDFDPTGAYTKITRRTAKEFSSELFSNAAIEFLRKQDGGSPFFCYVPYTAPHDPRMAPSEYAAMYPPEKIELPPNFMPEHPFDNGEMTVRDEGLAGRPRTPDEIRRHIAAYYAMITHLDAQIGRVLEALRASGQADNTIVIFAADNGLAVGRHGLMGKQNLYEHSVRVPLMIGGPGLPAGKRRSALVYLHDLFPTICDLAGIAIPETVESASLAPVISNSRATIRETIFAAYRNVQRMARDDRFKLIEYFEDGPVGIRKTQLFDLANDPWELKNLADDPKHALELERLRGSLADWRRKTSDPLRGRAE